MTTAEKIKKYRIGAGLTQTQAAAKCGMSYQAWQKYELGLRSPGMDMLAKIASAVGVKPGVLFPDKK